MFFKPNSNASTNSSRLFSTNLFDGSNTINISNAITLTSLFANSNTTLDWQELKELNGGNPIIFPMGTVPGTNTLIYWEVVYKNGDYITIWMNQPYTIEYFNIFTVLSANL